MWLKSLSLYGFKSFNKKVETNFSKGITVFVGPNGCGKSNIVDAIRWALGEQSARALRGTKMEEIIFGGTSQKKPLNYAEVSLTLDINDPLFDLDFREINIKRRLFRSGESEYHLNKVSCRLKDITELFWGTGVGKEAYSFIGQGKVEEIIRARPEERREIFEEAAGILKYKYRKKETWRRLLEVDGNLQRVDDLINELQVQLEPLSKQSSICKRYLELQEKLSYLQLQLTCFDLSENKLKCSELDDRLHSVNMKLHECQKKVLDIEEKISSSRLEIKELEDKNIFLEDKLFNTNKSLESQKNRQSACQKQESKLHFKLDNLYEEKDLIEKQIIKDNGRFRDINSQLDQKRLLYDEQRNELSRVEENIKKIEKLYPWNQIEQKEKDSAHYSNKLAKIEGTLININENYSAIVRKNKGLSEKMQELNRKLDVTELNLKDIKSKISINDKELKQAYREHEKLLQEKKICENKIEDNHFKLSQLNSKEKNLQTKLNFLLRIDTEYKGYLDGARAVLKASKAGNLTGIIGDVASLINVSGKYERAIEVALGGAIQYIVAEDLQAAKKAIEYLKKTKSGRVTLIPLNVLRKSQTYKFLQKYKDQPGVAGIASEIVNYDNKFNDLFNFLLGRVLITNNFNSATEIAQKLSSRVLVVTLDGEIIIPGRTITGGSFTQARKSYLLSRRQEYEEAKKELLLIEEKIQKFLSEQELFNQALKKNKRNFQSLKDTIDIIKNEKEFLHEKNTIYKNQNKKVKDLIEFHTAEQEKLKLEIEDCLAKKGKKQEERDILSQGAERINQELKELKLRYNFNQGERREMEDKITEYKINIASLTQEILDLEKHKKQIESEIESKKEQLSTVSFNISKISDDKQIFKEKIEKIIVNINHIEKEKKDISGKLSDFLQIRKNHIQQLEGLEEQLDSWNKKRHNLEQKKHQSELGITRLNSEITHLENKLLEEFNLPAGKDLKQVDINIDPQKIEKEIHLIKVNIESLGIVNTGAIDEYRRLSQRLDFLISQRQDLKKGEKSLKKVLAEVNEKMIERFESAYKQIDENFYSIFREFFNGGRAYIKLSDPDNILESGIEIIAQPPGKKLQNIMLLSGGEKALTAIALLFSILKYKPAPFCILDEIDTSLDETNLTRLVEYLDNLSNNIQFIIVTHRQKIMERADVVYGVTMQELGVSELFSINNAKEKVV